MSGLSLPKSNGRDLTLDSVQRIDWGDEDGKQGDVGTSCIVGLGRKFYADHDCEEVSFRRALKGRRTLLLGVPEVKGRKGRGGD